MVSGIEPINSWAVKPAWLAGAAKMTPPKGAFRVLLNATYPCDRARNGVKNKAIQIVSVFMGKILFVSVCTGSDSFAEQ